MANIQERKTNDGKVRYRVLIRLKGFPTQTATFERKTDAKLWAQQTEAAIREGRHFKTTQAKKHTLADLIERYIRDVLPSKPKSAKRKTQLIWWKDQIGAYTLADMSPPLLAETRDKLAREVIKGKQRAPATVVRYMAALSHAFTIAVNEWEWIDTNPLQKVSRPTEPRGRVRFLSDDKTLPDGSVIEGERTRLLKTCKNSGNPFLYTVVVLALSTGARKNEIMSLTWADIDLKRERIILHETKNKERRALPLVGHAKEQIKKMSKVRQLDTALLFPGKNHLRPIELRKPWVSALKKADIKDFRFHDLRHSCASYLAMNNASLAEIAEILGHKTLQMVKRYAHLSEAHTADVVCRMNDKIFG